jgi:hypothetical protein
MSPPRRSHLTSSAPTCALLVNGRVEGDLEERKSGAAATTLTDFLEGGRCKLVFARSAHSLHPPIATHGSTLLHRLRRVLVGYVAAATRLVEPVWEALNSPLSVASAAGPGKLRFPFTDSQLEVVAGAGLRRWSTARPLTVRAHKGCDGLSLAHASWLPALFAILVRRSRARTLSSAAAARSMGAQDLFARR